MEHIMQAKKPQYTACAEYVDALCKRYKDRGIAAHVRLDAKRQERDEALSHAMAPGAYIMAEKVSDGKADKYRTGLYKGTRYMTADDFVRYYHDQRSYKMPNYNVRTAEPMQTDDKQEATGGQSPKKALWLTVTEQMPQSVRKYLESPATARLAEISRDWFPIEKEERCEKSDAKKMPAGVLGAMLTVTLCAFMIVGSSVMVSLSVREASILQSELDALNKQYTTLNTELSLKNDMLEIERIAVQEYGMVRSDFVSTQVLTTESENTVEVYETKGEFAHGLSNLLSAIGIIID
jgi:cell division protein FtsL